MAEYRIASHPILSAAPPPRPYHSSGKGRQLKAQTGETIASALFANGIRVFGHHPKDGSPQGIFCANGQCAQCLVLADGMPVKSCMEPVAEGMQVEPVDALPELPQVNAAPAMQPIEEIEVPVLIIGGGPAGMSAAIQLGQRGIRCLLVDDKDRLGGKLVLQTHRFFGSINAVYAGTRGIDIATRLEGQVRELPEVEVWLNSTALAVFSDRKVGILRRRARNRRTCICQAAGACWWRRARGRSRSPSGATPCRASTGRARSRRWSIATSFGRPSACSSSAAATSA